MNVREIPTSHSQGLVGLEARAGLISLSTALTSVLRSHKTPQIAHFNQPP